MPNRTDIAHLIGQLNERSPSGFAIALHISYATPAFLFQSYAPEWMAEYSRRGLHLQDPTVAWGFSHTGAVRWSALEEQDTGGVFALAREHGLLYGITIAVLLEGSRSVASFSRPDREFTDEEIARITDMVNALHIQTAGTDSLSPADRSALKAMSIRLTHAS